jgi:hypothetical protein
VAKWVDRLSQATRLIRAFPRPHARVTTSDCELGRSPFRWGWGEGGEASRTGWESREAADLGKSRLSCAYTNSRIASSLT